MLKQKLYILTPFYTGEKIKSSKSQVYCLYPMNKNLQTSKW